MAVLGIEGTAHTLGVGIVEESAPGRCRILANERAMVIPPTTKPGEVGLGIHPREAAHHHAEVGPTILHEALAAAKVAPEELEGIAFSQGPGLGPCLRVAATMARALAVRHNLPLLGVNHCVAHLEIGRGLTDARDPMLLYASGANTQVIGLVRGRYRVFGETLDVGLGNALDKFAREHGIAFPGGPEVERLAAQADPAQLLPLPYNVKGMDMSFAGMATAAARLVRDGHGLPQVCHALQEHAYAALVETAERALAHTRKQELLLGGGVACNARLQAMAKSMCEERGAQLFVPPRAALSDNGAMIAWLGLRKLRAKDITPLATSEARPYERTDMVAVTWLLGASEATQRPPSPNPSAGHENRMGAEATVSSQAYLGRPLLAKRRLPKHYRHAILDGAIRDVRTRDEAHLLMSSRRAGLPVPLVYDVDRAGATLLLEPIEGQALLEQLDDDEPPQRLRRLGTLGQIVGQMHDAGITHGDLTTSNVLVPAPAREDLVLIDFGLGALSVDDETRGVDLHLVEEALHATHAEGDALFAAFLSAYEATARCAPGAVQRLHDIRERGRNR